MKSTTVLNNSPEAICNLIKEKIVTGVYKPSEKLVESKLALELGVSRNTIKNAFLLLEKENLVEFERNVGTKVKAFSLEDVKNYLEIREVLEGVIIKSAISSITEEAINKLEAILIKMKNHIDEGMFDEYSKLNKVFHNIIYESSTNQQAVEMVNVIKTQLIRYHFRTILVPGRTSESLKEHKEIFKALKNKDPLAAEEAIKTHISHVRETIDKYYQFLL